MNFLCSRSCYSVIRDLRLPVSVDKAIVSQPLRVNCDAYGNRAIKNVYLQCPRQPAAEYTTLNFHLYNKHHVLPHDATRMEISRWSPVYRDSRRKVSCGTRAWTPARI